MSSRSSANGHIGIVLRFGWFYGFGAKHSEEFLALAKSWRICLMMEAADTYVSSIHVADAGEEFLALAKSWRICLMMGAADTYVSSIHVADAGRAVVAALNASAGTYNIVDDIPLTKREFADAIANAAGRRVYLRAPGRIANLLGDGVEPQAYIADVIAKIANDWPASSWDELMPWNWKHLPNVLEAQAAYAAVCRHRLPLASQIGMLPVLFIYVNAGAQLSKVRELGGLMSLDVVAALLLPSCLPVILRAVR